jgi:hypothetical protein
VTRNVARTAGTAALILLAFGAPPARAQDTEARPPAPTPILHLYGTAGASLHQNPLSTHVAEVLALDVRLGVPLSFGVEPWVDGTLARLRTGCTEDVTCPANEKRLLGGLIYQPGGRDPRSRGGPYFGAGLGTQSAGGVQKLAYSIIIGLPLATSPAFSPLFELRAERHEGVGDLLMISGGVRVGVVR